jgi:hypothetical protein
MRMKSEANRENRDVRAGETARAWRAFHEQKKALRLEPTNMLISFGDLVNFQIDPMICINRERHPLRFLSAKEWCIIGAVGAFITLIVQEDMSAASAWGAMLSMHGRWRSPSSRCEEHV